MAQSHHISIDRESRARALATQASAIDEDATRLPEAERLYRQALWLNRGSSPTLWCNLGNVLCAQHRVVEAVECYEKALELGPSDLIVRTNLGLAYMRLERQRDATLVFRAITRTYPQYDEGWYYLGLAANDVAEKRMAFYEYLRLAPDGKWRSNALNALVGT